MRTFIKKIKTIIDAFKTIVDEINNSEETDLHDNVKLIKQLLINDLSTSQSVEIFKSVQKDFKELLEKRRVDAKKEDELIMFYFEGNAKETISLEMFNNPIFSRKLAEVEVNY